jgi:hypothetical protein
MKMKEKIYKKLFVFGLIGLFFFTTINPALALVHNKLQENTVSTTSTDSYTYKIAQTYIFGVIENQTNVHYDLVFSRPRPDSNYSFGLYKDITVQGTTRELHIWLFPFLVNYFKVFQNGVFAVDNRYVTIKIPLLLRGNIYDEPDAFWFSGRALGVTLTIEE